MVELMRELFQQVREELHAVRSELADVRNELNDLTVTKNSMKISFLTTLRVVNSAKRETSRKLTKQQLLQLLLPKKLLLKLLHSRNATRNK